jgi:hypothetical protein
MERLWDEGQAAYAVEEFVHERAALLAGPGEALLVALPRPMHARQILIAVLRPPGITRSEGRAAAPRDIAVPAVAARAAAAIRRRLLPRYVDALVALRGPALLHAYTATQRALDRWNDAVDLLFDDDGRLLDRRALDEQRARRDADAWSALETVLAHGPGAIHQAHTDLAGLGLPAATASGLSHSLWILAGAVSEGTHARDTWDKILVPLANAPRDPEQEARFAAGLLLRHAAGWPAMETFATHYPALTAIESIKQTLAPGNPRSTAAGARRNAAPGTGTGTGRRTGPASLAPQEPPRRRS